MIVALCNGENQCENGYLKKQIIGDEKKVQKQQGWTGGWTGEIPGAVFHIIS